MRRGALHVTAKRSAMLGPAREAAPKIGCTIWRWVQALKRSDLAAFQAADLGAYLETTSPAL
jgi:hypothetical protein